MVPGSWRVVRLWKSTTCGWETEIVDLGCRNIVRCRLLQRSSTEGLLGAGGNYVVLKICCGHQGCLPSDHSFHASPQIWVKCSSNWATWSTDNPVTGLAPSLEREMRAAECLCHLRAWQCYQSSLQPLWDHWEEKNNPLIFLQWTQDQVLSSLFFFFF